MLLFQVMRRVKGNAIILVEHKDKTTEKIFEGIATDWDIDELGIKKYGSNDVIGVGGDLETSATTVVINGD